jgi:thiol-disulfide isomerase/thioredoxin
VVDKVGGGKVDLAALKGKPVWVDFMGTYCPSCQDELPLMNGFAARYASAGLVVVAVDIREDATTVTQFATALNVTFPVGLDQDGSVASSWGAVALPVHFWVDAEGIIRAGALGGIGADSMASNLQTVLPGVKVTP